MIDEGKKYKELTKILDRYQVVVGYLFGSAAKDTVTPLSDIDIAVLFDKTVAPSQHIPRELAIAREAGTLFGINQIDVVNLLTVANPLLKHNIVAEGKVLMAKDPAVRRRMEKRIMDEYEDTRHLRNVARRILERQIKEKTFGHVSR